MYDYRTIQDRLHKLALMRRLCRPPRYIVTYNYHTNNTQWMGDYYTTSLTEVFAFGDMVKRYGGICSCNIGVSAYNY